MSTELSAVCRLVKGGLDPRRYADDTFAHYSIPAFDSGVGPVIELGGNIHSQKTPIPSGVVLVSKLNPRIPRVWYVNDNQPYQRICSTEFVALQPDPTMLDPEYLSFALREALQGGVIKGNTAAATKSRERAKPTDFLRLRVKVPSLSRQRRIVDLLSRAENIVRMRREAEQKAKEIIPALFLEMFGNLGMNSNGGDAAGPREHGEGRREANSVVRLGDVAEVVSGVAKGRKLVGKVTREVPYLRVANVQAGGLDLAEMKCIPATADEIAELAVRSGDVLLTEGGDFDKVGRGALLEADIGECIHQNHVFRVRTHADRVMPEYFAAYLQTSAARQYFLKAAKKTSNLASINMTQLRNLPLPLPRLETQQKFQERFRACRALEKQQSDATGIADVSFQSLLAGVFSERQVT